MSILENAKDVAKAVHEINNLDLYQRVLNLHSDIIELVEENNHLRAEVAELKKDIEIKGKLKPVMGRDSVYFLATERGEQDDGPFCPVCWDVDRKLVRAVPYGDGTHTCSYCLSFRQRGR
jgi:regulator of replication initiation timing